MIIMSKKTIRAQAAAEEMNYRLSALNPLPVYRAPNLPQEGHVYADPTFLPKLACDFCPFFNVFSAILEKLTEITNSFKQRKTR